MSKGDDLQEQTDIIMKLIKLQILTYTRLESVSYLESVIKLLISTRIDKEVELQSLEQVNLSQEIKISEQENYIKSLLSSCNQYENLINSLREKLSQQENILSTNAVRIHELEEVVNKLTEKDKFIH